MMCEAHPKQDSTIVGLVPWCSYHQRLRVDVLVFAPSTLIGRRATKDKITRSLVLLALVFYAGWEDFVWFEV